MRRSLVLGSLVVLVVAGRVTADDWKWDPKVRRPAPRVGEKRFKEADEHRTQSFKLSRGEREVKNHSEEVTLAFRYVREVVAVSDERVSETLVNVEKWKQEKKGQKPDATLEGHTVRVTGVGLARTFSIEDDPDKKVSADALRWVEDELAPKRETKDGEGEDADARERESLSPPAPVAENAEWKPDPAKYAKAIAMADVEVAKSRAEAKLSTVRVENGVRAGAVDAKVSLAITLPHVKWTEGGVLEVAIHIDASLEPDKKDFESWHEEVTFAGKGDAEGDQGVLLLEQSATAKRTVKSGPVDH